MAASLDGLHLVYDTGPSNSDSVTADPQVAAFVSGCGEGNSVEAQFDHFGDGSVDGYSYVYYASQELTYDPRSFDYTLASYSGSFTLNHRVIERDAMYNVVSESAWQSFTFTLQPPPIPEIAVTYADPYYGYQTELYDGSTSVSFGTTAVDAPVSQSFTVSNPGTGVLTLELFSVTLPTGFSLIGLFPGSIDPGDSATFTVRLDAATPGFFSGPLSFSTNDGDEDSFDFSLTGEVTATQPEIAVAYPDTYGGSPIEVYDGWSGVSLGGTAVGTSLDGAFTISNAGAGTLTLEPSSLVLPAGFSLLGAFPDSIAPEGFATFTIRLAATSAGFFSGTLWFSTNDADENPFDFYLDGEVTAPQPEIAVTYADPYNGYPTEVYDGYGSMDFGSTMVDAPLQRTFTISNSGAGTLALVPSSLVLPEGFSLHTAFPETVGPDDSTSFTVWLDATDAGCFSGTLSFNTNDGDENPFAFYVSGEVTGSSAANLAPTLDAIANPPAIDEDAGLQTVGLTGITAGGSEIQNLSVTATSSNPQLVPNPSVIYTSPGTAGTLTFVPAANQSGAALITVTVTDDGGTGYGGVDRVEQSFLVAVAPVNDSPALVQAIAPIVVSEGSVMTTVGLATYFQDVDLATSGDTLHYEVTVNAPNPEEPLYNADLLAAWIENGGLKVVYAAGQTGHVDLTLRAVDQAGLAAQTMVAVTVVPVPVNDSPAALPIPPVTVDEDAADVVLNLLDFFSDAEDPDEDLLLDVALASSPQTNPAAFALDAGTGRLTLSFLPEASGAAQYTVSARDSGGKTAQTALSVTVTAVNDPPAGPAAALDVTLRDASQETVVDLWQYFDDAEEGTDLAYEIVADSLANPEVLDGTPVIDADGYLRLRAAADVNGTAALTVQAGDAEGATALATFTFTTAAAGGTSCTATAAPVPTGPLSPLALPPFDPSAPYLPPFIDPTTMDCYRSPTLTLTASPTDLVEKQEFTIAVAWTNTYHLVLQSPYLASGQLVIKRFEFTSEVGHYVAGPLSYGQPDSRLLPMSGFYAGTAQVTLEFADDMPSGTAADVMSVVLAAVGYCHHPASVTVAPTVNNGDPSVVFETRAVVKDQDGQPLLDGNGNPQTVSAAGFNEGDAVIVRGHVTDPALGVPTETFCQSQIAWGDGSVQSLNVNPNDGAFEAKHMYRDDNPTATPSDTYTIIVTATDDDGGVTTQTRTVTVNNVEPTVTIDRIEVRDAVLSTNPVTGVSTYLNPGQLDESEGFKIFGTVTDAGVLDKQTVTLRMDLNFDRDTDDPGETSGPITPDPDGPGRWKFEYTVAEVVDDGGTYDADGNRVWGNETESDDITIHAEVVDDDAGTGSGQSTAIVYNVAPAFLGEPFLTFGYDDDANPTSVTVHGDFSDRGSQDMHELYITWGDGKYGDGSTPTNQPIPVQDGAFEVTRLFSVGEVDEESDVYPVLLRLKDDDTGQATKTLESCGCGACTAEPASNTAEQPNPAASSPATVPAASSPVDDNAFWTTNTGRLLKDRIKDALVALKGTIDCLLTADPMRPDHNELMFIRDNIGTVSVTPDGSLSGGPQATPTPTVDDSTSPKKLTKLEIHLRVANLFNASCTPSADEIPVTIPLLGHMRMDKTSMNALNGNMYALAQGNEDDLRTAGQKKPTTEMWDEMQIAALIANELLRGMKACGLYAYEEEFAPAMTPRLLFPGGNQVWDFFRSLPANRQYTRPTAPDAIMHEIYYSGCG